MDAVTGALVAGAAAAASILAAAVLPMRRADPAVLRAAGACSIALTGASLLGASLPAMLPLAVLAAGIVASLALGRRARAEAPETP